MKLARLELARLYGEFFDWRTIAMNGEPDWLTHALCATEAARQKLRQWFAAGGLERPALSLEELYVQTTCYGDSWLHKHACRVLHVLPPPVRDYAVQQATFLGVGVSLQGWCGPPIDQGERRFLIVLTGHVGQDHDQLVREAQFICAHEIGHAWLLEEPAGYAMDAFTMETLHDTAIETVPEQHAAMVAARRRRYAKHERDCEALVGQWGFRA